MEYINNVYSFFIMKYWIDNKYYVEENVDNAVIIQKCFDIAIDIPCFCYTESLSIAGNCRMCMSWNIK